MGVKGLTTHEQNICFLFQSYSSPDDGENAIEENQAPSVLKASEKLKNIVKMIEEYSNAAVYGDEINIVTTDNEDDDESGSGSGDGSGSSGGSGTNEIPIDADATPTDPINGVDNLDNDDNVVGGGVGGNTQGQSRNSASQTVVGAWLFYSAILLLCSSLVP